MSPTYLFNRDTGFGWPAPIHEQPTRGPKAHEPVEMKEKLPYQGWFCWTCPVCGREEQRRDHELPKGFIGITCAGDAVLEGVVEG